MVPVISDTVNWMKKFLRIDAPCQKHLLTKRKKHDVKPNKSLKTSDKASDRDINNDKNGYFSNKT